MDGQTDRQKEKKKQEEKKRQWERERERVCVCERERENQSFLIQKVAELPLLLVYIVKRFLLAIRKRFLI